MLIHSWISKLENEGMKKLILMLACTFSLNTLAEEIDFCVMYAPENTEVVADNPETKVLCVNDSEITVYETVRDHYDETPSTSMKTFYVDSSSEGRSLNILIVPFMDASSKAHSPIVLNRSFFEAVGDMQWGEQRFQFSIAD